MCQIFKEYAKRFIIYHLKSDFVTFFQYHIVSRGNMSQRWMKKIPMMLTYGRMLISIYFIWLISVGDDPQYRIISLIVFIIAAISDWADGYLSRKFNCTTIEGKLLDPIADKILVITALFALLSFGKIDYYLIFLLIVRDLYISGLRATAVTKNIIIQSQMLGKIKTALQLICIGFLLIDLPVNWINKLAYSGLWISVLISLASGLQYQLLYSRQSRGTH